MIKEMKIETMKIYAQSDQAICYAHALINWMLLNILVNLFVLFEVLRHSQPNGVMSSAVS